MGYLDRYLVECQKCGYKWLSRKQHPKRCALCHNLNPGKPKVRLSVRERILVEMRDNKGDSPNDNAKS